MKRIYIVDDHPIVRVGIIQLISQENDFEICGQAGNYFISMKEILSLKPDIVVVDISIEGGNGIDLITNIRMHLRNLLILVFSMHDEKFFAERAINAGAQGFLMKQEPSEKIVAALRIILTGSIYLSDFMKEQILNKLIGKKSMETSLCLEKISNREMVIFKLMGEGYKPGQIAEKINLSVKTIDSYIQRIKIKLKIKTASELTRKAIQWNKYLD